MKKLARIVGISSSVFAWLQLTGNAFAQFASASAEPVVGKGGTSGSLPSAGSTDLTYLLFIGGTLLFVFGILKVVLAYRD